MWPWEWFPQMPLFFRSYLKCITFLASFETLNIPITYELFCNSPKEGMIKGLWKNHSHESMVCTLNHLIVQAALCSDAIVTQVPATTQLPERQNQGTSSFLNRSAAWDLLFFPILAGAETTRTSLYLSSLKLKADGRPCEERALVIILPKACLFWAKEETVPV